MTETVLTHNSGFPYAAYSGEYSILPVASQAVALLGPQGWKDASCMILDYSYQRKHCPLSPSPPHQRMEKLDYVVCLDGEGKEAGMNWEYEVKRNDWGLDMGKKEGLRGSVF